MILAAKAHGISSVWLGTRPQIERVKKQAVLADLPEPIIPPFDYAFGHLANKAPKKPDCLDCYDATRVHNEQ